MLPSLLLAAISAAPPGLDALGDPLPEGAILRLGTARLRLPDRSESLALSPDGRIVAAADYRGRVRLWDTATGRLLVDLPAGNAECVAFSPDGKAFATAGAEKKGALRDVRTGELLRSFPDLAGPAVAFSPDGKMIASSDGRGDPVVCDVATGRFLKRLAGLPCKMLSVAFSPDGKALAAGDNSEGRKATAIVWDIATREERCRIEDTGGGWMRGVAFSPDGKTLATATPYKTWLWDAATGKRLADLGNLSVNAVAFHPDGRLVTAGDDIRFLDPKASRAVLAMHQGRNFAGKLALSADGKVVASNGVYDSRVRIWDAETGEQRLIGPGHLDEVRAVAWSRDGQRIATGCGGDGTLRTWDAATGLRERVFRMGGALNHFSQSSDLSDLAFTRSGKAMRVAGRQWVVATGEAVAIPVGRRRTARSPDGRLVAMDDERGSVIVQDDEGRELRRVRAMDEESSGYGPGCLAFSQDGKLLAIAQVADRLERQPAQASVHLFDTATGKPVRRLRPSRSLPENLAFSPDGTLLAASQWRGQVALFDTATGEQVAVLEGHDDGQRHWDGVRPLAFSPDGAILATSGEPGVVVLWETATAQEIRALRGHEGWVRALAFSPDGTRLLSGGSDTTAVIWHSLPPASTGDAWGQLAQEPGKAYPALAALLRSPAATVRLLGANLRPDDPADAGRIERLVADLGADEFQTRQDADDSLARLGKRAEAALRRALVGKPDLEVRKRVGRLLSLLGMPLPAELRDRRAVQALERIGTREAAAVLEKLSRGGESGPLTRAARAALERLRAGRPARLDALAPVG